jgi:hypothetical protein
MSTSGSTGRFRKYRGSVALDIGEAAGGGFERNDRAVRQGCLEAAGNRVEGRRAEAEGLEGIRRRPVGDGDGLRGLSLDDLVDVLAAVSGERRVGVAAGYEGVRAAAAGGDQIAAGRRAEIGVDADMAGRGGAVTESWSPLPPPSSVLSP